MQTVETPSEQPEREFAEPLPVINEQAIMGEGFHIMRRMYREPYKPFMFFSDWLSYKQWVKKVAELIVLGYVAVDSTSSGFQLTANGRLMFHEYYTAFQARLEREAEREAELERLCPRDPDEEHFWSEIYDIW